MARLAALYTSDAALIRCEIDRVREEIDLDGNETYAGVGTFYDNVVLHRTYASGIPRDGIWDVPDSDAAIFASGSLHPGQKLEDNAQPFRFRHWLFAAIAETDRSDEVRRHLFDTLPEFLQSLVRGTTLEEVLFAVFLSHLRKLGRTEDPSLEAPLAAQILMRVGRAVDDLPALSPSSVKPKLIFAASNGRMLVAARRGDLALSYRLLEGTRDCERCGLTAMSKDVEPQVRDHRRRRSIVLASHPKRPEGWAQMPEGGGLAVDRNLTVQLLSSF